MANPLPEYERPPIDEVVVGVQFEPLKDFHVAHLGRFWSKVRDRYPLTEDQPPLPAQIEHPEPKPAESRLTFATGIVPTPRSWFLDNSKNRLLQLQHDRFLRNWRRTEGN